MVTTTNGSSHKTAPLWQEKAGPLTEQWQARMRERQAAQMAAAEPVEVELPSGLMVFAIRANLISLKEAGRIPDAITPYAMSLLKITQESGEEATSQRIQESANEFEQLCNAVWLASVVAPKFTSDLVADEDAIPMREVEGFDKLALFNWAQGVEDHLALFRGLADAARTSPDSEGVQPPPSPYVRRRSDAGTDAGVQPDAGDVLRGDIDRQPPQADPPRTGRSARAAAQGSDVEGSPGVDLQASGRTGRCTSGRNRRG